MCLYRIATHSIKNVEKYAFHKERREIRIKKYK